MHEMIMNKYAEENPNGLPHDLRRLGYIGGKRSRRKSRRNRKSKKYKLQSFKF